MSNFKRNNDLIKKVQEEILDNLPKNDTTTAPIINELVKVYENATYKEYDDRHKFYRDAVSDMVNDMCFEDAEMAKSMANDHPTLQQKFMKLCMMFIKNMASKPYYDGRNERSGALAKKIVDTVGDDMPYLPLI